MATHETIPNPALQFAGRICDGGVNQPVKLQPKTPPITAERNW